MVLYLISYIVNMNIKFNLKFYLSTFFLMLVMNFSSIGVNYSQVLFNKKKVDFKSIRSQENSFTDFIVTNTGEKVEFILRADVSRNVIVKYSTKKIFPDSSAIIRVKYVSTKPTDFNESIKLYFGSTINPIILNIKGQTQYTENGLSASCPDFSNTASAKSNTSDVEVLVIDKNSQKPISNAMVIFYATPWNVEKCRTDRNGLCNPTISIGYHFFEANSDGYLPSVVQQAVKLGYTKVIIELEPKIDEELEVGSTPKDEVLEEEPVQNKEEYVVDETIEVIVPEIISPTNVPIEDIVNGKLSTSTYKPNNIVFLLDVSTSMGMSGRMGILKSAMIELVKVMRDVDLLSVVTYSSKAEILLTALPGNNQEKISEVIFELEAGGLTAGGKGLDLAYQIAEDNFIKNGNNHVYIATDGAFNVGGKASSMLKKISSKSEKGVNLSVVGVKSPYQIEKELKKMSVRGGGVFTKVDESEDSKSSVLNLIKLHSYMR